MISKLLYTLSYRLSVFLLGCCLYTLPTFAQRTHAIYKIEDRLMKGDRTALTDIAPFLDNKETITEFLGYHLLQPQLRSIAQRMLEENCLFTDREIRLTDSLTWHQFSSFVQTNKDSIYFSPLATAFMITPLEQRTARFEIRQLTEARRKQLAARSSDLLMTDWVRERKIDSFILHKDPYALVLTASQLFKERNRFNRYQGNEMNFIDLISFLTGTEIAVENEKKELTWHVDKDYYATSRLNLLIYFMNHYKDYIWDDDKGFFVNTTLVSYERTREDELFQLLCHQDDSIAQLAFLQLTMHDTTQFTRLIREFDKAHIDVNHSIPNYRSLPQLSLFTAYCREQHIDHIGSPSLLRNVDLLKGKLPFVQRYKLENELANSLSFDDMTALEFWTHVYEAPWTLDYSTGRIADIFYSKHWQQLLANKKQLNWYLKKSALFERIAAGGVSVHYLRKFTNTSPADLALLRNHASNDPDIQAQLKKIAALVTNPPPVRPITFTSTANKDEKVKHPGKKITRLMRSGKVPNDLRFEIHVVLSKINYRQIPEALRAVAPFASRQESWERYDLLADDFGFCSIDNLRDQPAQDRFLALYAQHTEYEMYDHYLTVAGFDYKRQDSTLDYDKVYELLKYDATDRFTSDRCQQLNQCEVYSLIKLLELTFHTTLDFPRKLCNSIGFQACDAASRIQVWMQYLEEKKLLQRKHDEPVSFTCKEK